MRARGLLTILTGAMLVPLIMTAGGLSAATAASVAPAATAPKLQILFTNDDGYDAPGIATITSALAKLPNVHVTVVAPLNNQSGSGGSTTKGKLKITRVKTLDGRKAYAVGGYPADTIRAAINQLHLHPDLVVSGINAGQNLGPVLDLSGTIGAARAAVARGIPAVAVSSGLADTIRFKAAVPFVMKWVTAHRAALAQGHAATQVVSFNVPSCSKGSVRGLAHVKPDLNNNDLGKALKASKCTSKAPHGKTDVKAFGVGFATESVVPAKPKKK